LRLLVDDIDGPRRLLLTDGLGCDRTFDTGADFGCGGPRQCATPGPNIVGPACCTSVADYTPGLEVVSPDFGCVWPAPSACFADPLPPLLLP
jgi:hypothetical protein